MNSINKVLIPLLVTTPLIISSPAYATTYTYEVSADQTWADGGSTTNTSETVTVRSYVPGSDTTTYTNVIIYTPVFTSEENALGDVVGSVYNLYGSGTTAFADPYDAPKITVIYPAFQILHTRRLSKNREPLGHRYLLCAGWSCQWERLPI